LHWSGCASSDVSRLLLPEQQTVVGPEPYFVCMREVGFHSKIVAVRTCTLRSVVPTYVCSS
jgi:hypothetical protein